MVDRPGLFVDYPAKGPAKRKGRSTGRQGLPCCATWRDLIDVRAPSRAEALVHTVAHSRVPFSLTQLMCWDGMSGRAEMVRAIDDAVIAKWIYELDDRNLYGPGPRLWQGKL